MSETIIRGKPSNLYEIDLLLGNEVNITHKELYDLVKPEGYEAEIITEIGASDKPLSPELPYIEALSDQESASVLQGCAKDACHPVTQQQVDPYGWDSALVGVGLVTSAWPMSKKILGIRNVGNASKNTNFWSILSLEKYPTSKLKLPFKVPTPMGYPLTKGFHISTSSQVFRIAGRWIPYVGWALIAYDVANYVSKKSTDKSLLEHVGEIPNDMVNGAESFIEHVNKGLRSMPNSPLRNLDKWKRGF